MTWIINVLLIFSWVEQIFLPVVYIYNGVFLLDYIDTSVFFHHLSSLLRRLILEKLFLS